MKPSERRFNMNRLLDGPIGSIAEGTLADDLIR